MRRWDARAWAAGLLIGAFCGAWAAGPASADPSAMQFAAASPALEHGAPVRKVSVELLEGRSGPPVRLHVEEQGEGPPVVLLHGLGASSVMWRRLAPALATRRTVYSIDLRGFGRSEKPLDKRYRIEDHAALIDAFLRKRDLRDVTIVGHSFGGAVALLLAVAEQSLARPRIARLVLMNSPAFPQEPSRGVRFLNKRVTPYIALSLVPPERAVRAALGADALAAMEPAALKEYTRPFRERGARHALIQTARGVEPERFDDVIARYPGLNVPTLLIWCRQDPVVPLAIGRRLAKTLPDARLRVIDDCGHVPPEQAPRATAHWVHGFLDRDGRRAAD